MRIVHVTSSSRGGGAIYMRQVARAQAAAGHHVVMVMPTDGEMTGASLSEEHVELYFSGTLTVEQFRHGNMSPPDFTMTPGEPDA